MRYNNGTHTVTTLFPGTIGRGVEGARGRITSVKVYTCSGMGDVLWCLLHRHPLHKRRHTEIFLAGPSRVVRLASQGLHCNTERTGAECRI